MIETPARCETIRLERFAPAHSGLWNEFVGRSKNGTFLFHRDYLEYHADRFEDHSLLAFQDQKLAALLPANRAGDMLISHGGLTYGGWVTDDRTRTGTMLDLFTALADHAANLGIRQLIYKPVPAIYHRILGDEDLYALFRNQARLIRRDVSSAIRLGARLPLTKGRKCGLKLARAQRLDVQRSDRIAEFMELEAALLHEKHGVQPTHTPTEMLLLAGRFPDNIKLFAAARDGQLLGGVLIYESNMVAHAQYIASTPEGRECSALDAIMDHLLNEVYRDKPYFDFGISTEADGRYLNHGLIENKESYGARAVVYDRYELRVGDMAAAANSRP
jgi:hypothetical protein